MPRLKPQAGTEDACPHAESVRCMKMRPRLDDKIEEELVTLEKVQVIACRCEEPPA